MGGKNVPEILFGLLQGLQNVPLTQGIKMQGVQNLVRNSVRNYAGVAKSCPGLGLDFCTGGKIVPKIRFAFLSGMQ